MKNHRSLPLLLAAFLLLVGATPLLAQETAADEPPPQVLMKNVRAWDGTSEWTPAFQRAGV
jgi:hypothetical protein